MGNFHGFSRQKIVIMEEVKENKGCLANFGTFLMLFLGSCFTGFICFQIMFQILAEGRSSGYGDIVLVLVAFGITIFSFLASSIFFVNFKNSNKIKFGWEIRVTGIFTAICIISYLFCLVLVASDY